MNSYVICNADIYCKYVCVVIVGTSCNKYAKLMWCYEREPQANAIREPRVLLNALNDF